MVIHVSVLLTPGIGVVKVVTVVKGGDCVSFPVEFSGVSQPIIDAIAKPAINRMLFMRITLVL